MEQKRHLSLRAAGWLALAVWMAAGVVQAQDLLARGFSPVARQAIPAVVFIQVEKTVAVQPRGEQPSFNDPFDFFGDDFLRRFFGPGHPRAPRQPQQPRQPRRFRQQGQGSGFIISSDGYILTNNHVVGDVDNILVRLHDGREFEAELVGTDPQSEVAVIKIDGQDLPVLPLGDSDDLEIGEWVIAVGNPFGLSATLTVGVVSALGRSNIGIADYEDFIQTDAAINPGNSGGPLLNANGEAIGINTAIYSRSGGYMGIGFAIPINMARVIQEQLVDTGRVERGFIGIGIQTVDTGLAESFGLDEPRGILITEVQPDSAGAGAGLEPGDIILSLNGRPVSDVGAFRNTVASFRPGTVLALTVLRDSETMELDIAIGSLDTAMGRDAQRAAEGVAARLGLGVRAVEADVARRLGVEPGRGVVVDAVESGSPAEQAGLRPGILIYNANRQEVNDAEEFHQALSPSEDSGRVLLLVSDGRRTQFISIALP